MGPLAGLSPHWIRTGPCDPRSMADVKVYEVWCWVRKRRWLPFGSLGLLCPSHAVRTLKLHCGEATWKRAEASSQQLCQLVRHVGAAAPPVLAKPRMKAALADLWLHLMRNHGQATLDFPDPQKQWKMIHICLFIELRVDWFNYLFHGGKIYIKWNLPFQLFLSAQFSGIKYIHFVMKPLPPSISTEFFIFPNWNSVLIKQ